MLFLLLRLSLCTLRHGDDPYAILSLPHSAPPHAIRARFLQLTRELHPDKNPGRDTTAEFVRMHDAYALLSDGDRKTLYDRFGTVGDLTSTAPSADESAFTGGTERIFARPPEPPDGRAPRALDAAGFDAFVGAARNSLILVSSTLFCEPCEAYERYFGLLRANLSQFFRMARLDAAEHPGLARRLNVSGVPTVVARTLEGGAVVARSLRRLARSPAELYDFALERWTARVREIGAAAQIPEWLRENAGRPKALYCARQPGRPLDYYAAVTALRPGPAFAFAVVGAAAVRGLPFATDGAHAGAVWRHADCPPRMAKGVGGVVELLERWAAPAMMELTQEGYSDYCQDECVVLLGRPDGRIVERACGVNLSTFWVSVASRVAKMIGEEEGTWVLLRPGEGSFAVLAEKWSSSVADIALRRQRPGALEFSPLPSGFGPDSDPIQILSSFTTVKKTVLEFVWSHFTDVIILLFVVCSCARRLKGRQRPGSAPPIR
jgi:curved DNA-binding protein CbpA